MRRFASFVLIAFFVGTSVAFGGAVYSSRVVEELWSSNPPESLREWAPVMNAAGRNFWSRTTPVTGLLAILTLATAWSTGRRHRVWRLTGSVLFILVAISSVAYFAPAIGRLSPPALDALSADEARAMVQQWVRLDSLRMLAVAGSWACALSAISLRDDGGQASRNAM